MADQVEGTYRIYKGDTSAVLTWLVETAQSCGHNLGIESNKKPTTTVTPRPKGKARKHTSEAKQHVQSSKASNFNLKDFTACAEAVAKSRSPIVVMPPGILKVANRAL